MIGLSEPAKKEKKKQNRKNHGKGKGRKMGGGGNLEKIKGKAGERIYYRLRMKQLKFNDEPMGFANIQLTILGI